MSAANQTRKRIARGFTITDAMMNDFKASLKPLRIKIDEAAFKQDEAFILAMIHYDIDLALFGVEEARRNLIRRDPQAQFAIDQFGDAVRLTEMTRNRASGGEKNK
jgi:hypothetical protein